MEQVSSVIPFSAIHLLAIPASPPWHPSMGPQDINTCIINSIMDLNTFLGSYLRSNVDIRPSCLPGNLDPVWQRGCGCLGPATATILGNVLVLGLCQVVDTINISPKPFPRKVLNLYVIILDTFYSYLGGGSDLLDVFNKEGLGWSWGHGLCPWLWTRAWLEATKRPERIICFNI